MKRRISLVLATFVFLFGGHVFAIESNPGGGFLEGLRRLLTTYDKIQAMIPAHVANINRKRLADRMQHLADAFFQLKIKKRELTEAISYQRADPFFYGSRVNNSLRALRSTIQCLQANLDDLGLQIRNQEFADGIEIERQLSRGLSRKAKNVNEIARNLGLVGGNDTDAFAQIQAESEKSEKLADELANRSLLFAHNLDPNSSPPLEHRSCVPPVTMDRQ